MKTTFRNLSNAMEALQRLNTVKRKKVKLALALADQIEVIQPVFDKLDKLRRELQNEHALKGGNDQPVTELINGQLQIKMEDQFAFDEDMRELLETEVEFEIKAINLKQFGKKQEWSGSDLSALRRVGVLEIDVDEEEDDEDD